jgi:transposase
MSHFRPCDRDTSYLLPPSLDDWLPKNHLARFVAEIVDQLDLSGLIGVYRGAGSAAYHPAMLLALLIYGYATGTYSSRRIEQATYDSLAFRYIAANTHPDHDTLCAFRKRFLKEIEGLFVQVLCIAKEMKLLQLGTVALDGTKMHANASRHSALSYGHAEKLEAQLRLEVGELLARAEAADAEPLPEGLNLPEELARREERLKAIGEAKAEIKARAAERFAREQADHEAKVKARQEQEARTGRKPRRGPSEPHRSRLAHHARIGRGLRAKLQCPSGGRYRHDAGGRDGTEPSRQRQTTDCADGGDARRLTRGTGRSRRALDRRRLLQRGQRGHLCRGGDRAPDRHRP